MKNFNQNISQQNGNREVSDMLLKANLTDQGNAECLSALYGDWIRYCAERGCWMLWNDGLWRPDSDHEARQMIVETARRRRKAAAALDTKDEKNFRLAKDLSNWSFISERRNIVKNTLEAAADLPELRTTINQYDANINLLGVRNGVVDLTTGKFRESDPEDYLTMQSDIEFDENARAPKWEKFLEQIFNGDRELIQYIQRAVGYSLTGDTSEQVLFLLWGKGANGKSVFLYVIKELLGSYAATASFDTFDAKRRGDQTNDLARLKGKRLVTIIESEEDRYLAEAKIKAVTGEDTITCRFLHKEYFEYEPQFKIWLAMNHKPRIRGTDDGIWRRLRLIPFTRQFNEKQRDKHLRSKLRAELSGVLNWALEGLAMYRREGLGEMPQAIRTATDEYRRESDVIGQWIDESVVEKAGVETSAKELYQSYREWMLERGLVPKGSPELGKELASRGFASKRKTTGMVYQGITLSGFQWADNVENFNEHRAKRAASSALGSKSKSRAGS